jgi:hypothetical protein
MYVQETNLACQFHLVFWAVVAVSGIDKMRERASAARRHLLNFCRHILKY